MSRLDRYELDREERVVELDGGTVRVKVGLLDGRVVNLAPGARRLRGACQVGGPLRKVGVGRGARPRPEAMTTSEQLETRIRSLESCVVAFSGGVDSSLVAALAVRTLGERALAVTAVSPALATGELDGARDVARAIGIAHETITTAELEREGYRANGRDRCYHCKTELYDELAVLAERRGFAAVLSGANADDVGDWARGSPRRPSTA